MRLALWELFLHYYGVMTLYLAFITADQEKKRHWETHLKIQNIISFTFLHIVENLVYFSPDNPLFPQGWGGHLKILKAHLAENEVHKKKINYSLDP